MGFVDRTEPRFPSQGSIASHGGLIHRACAFFTTAIQIPALPNGPEPPPSGPAERFVALLAALVLFLALVLLVRGVPN